jgi:hypothetical protein
MAPDVHAVCGELVVNMAPEQQYVSAERIKEVG